MANGHAFGKRSWCGAGFSRRIRLPRQPLVFDIVRNSSVWSRINWTETISCEEAITTGKNRDSLRPVQDDSPAGRWMTLHLSVSRP
jgi:hypothetical protein